MIKVIVCNPIISTSFLPAIIMIFVIKVKMAQPKTKGRMSKKARLSKYRRKSANAKERERMKKQNDVFEVISNFSSASEFFKILPLLERDIARISFFFINLLIYLQVLKQILPVDKARKKDEDKETKVRITSHKKYKNITYRKLRTIPD